MIHYRLIRSKRKTIAIHVTKYATVEVRAPMKVPKSEIDHFIESKQSWINNHLLERKQLIENKEAFTLTYGDVVLMQGKEYPIIAKAVNHAGFDGACFYIPPDLTPNGIKQVVIQIYRLAAKRLFTNKVIDYSQQMSVTPIAVKINGAKTRWGSCSGRNSINFSWRLVMADDDVIDYVVVHELAHIKEHNHSDRFWAVVANILPDYKMKQAKLKMLQQRLASEDWE